VAFSAPLRVAYEVTHDHPHSSERPFRSLASQPR
jgi:hypothetical protein